MQRRVGWNGAAVVAFATWGAVSGCRHDTGCPSGMEPVAAPAGVKTELWCKTPDGSRARWFELTAEGGKRQVCSYVDGRPEGQYLAWHANGRTWIEGAYREGTKVGKWDQWDDAGAHVAQGEYRSGEFVAGAPVGFPAKCEARKP